MKTDCHLDYETVLCGRAEVVHLALVFKAEKQASARQTPFAFGLVIDNSGSMAGRPLEYAKSAATMVLKHLRDDDRFGLVVFSDSARTIIPLQVPSDKARLQAAIADIRGNFNLPVVFLTAHADSQTMERAAGAGAFGYVLKPFTGPGVKAAIEVALHKHQTETEARQAAKSAY